ncbi:hypothetical protein [Sorangium cellulosum]|uniref:hypothetical protein n=1 Tax=Sorangium cellulosum TaxID=56 RepID=UPI001F5D3384|nr:hypothetical protein [Sorangium cellulosum]
MSSTLMWELSWVRKLGLEDIDWDPERYCEHCRAERAARGEAVEDIAPPSETRIKFRLLGDGKDAMPSASASPARGGKPRRMKLVRLTRPDRTLH